MHRTRLLNVNLSIFLRDFSERYKGAIQHSAARNASGRAVRDWRAHCRVSVGLIIEDSCYRHRFHFSRVTIKRSLSEQALDDDTARPRPSLNVAGRRGGKRARS